MSGNIKDLKQLMSYLENHHHIDMSGDHHKQYLQNYGYYHGYKGYRYIRTPENRIPLNHFDQVIALNKFDMSLKALFYPHIMFLETALKNYVLEIIVAKSQSSALHDIYEKVLTEYKEYEPESSKFRYALDKRLDVRSRLYSTVARGYPKKQLISHFYHKDMHLPIWALFELISIGEFEHFVASMHSDIKKEVCNLLTLNEAYNKDGRLLENILDTLQELRNAVAHNEVVFDTRFYTKKPHQNLVNTLEIDTGITNIHFKYIVDYVVLIAYLLRHMNLDKTSIQEFIKTFKNHCDDIKAVLPDDIYKQIVHNDTNIKISKLL